MKHPIKILSFAVLCASQVVVAQDRMVSKHSTVLPQYTMQKSSLYVGGKLGVDAFSTKVLAGDVVEMDRLGQTNLTYGAFVGYRMPIAHAMSLGVETEITGKEGDYTLYADKSGEHSIIKTKMNASLVLGKEIVPTVSLYARLGVERMKYEIDPKRSSEDTLKKETENTNGVLMGLGTKFEINDQFSMRGEYRYTQYQELKFHDNEVKLKTPSSHLFAVDLIYNI